jgi:anti-repressor protein
MNELVKIESGKIGHEVKQTVSARELHAFLGVGKVFGAWIAERIESFGFLENQDFVIVSESGNNVGRPTKNYHLTIEMAKELSMVERNEKGKQARLYFIECEKRAKDPIAVLNDPAAMRGLLLTYTEKVLELQEEIKVMQPKLTILDRITASEASVIPTLAAKILNITPKKFFKVLSSFGWIYKRNGGVWIAKQECIKKGFLENKYGNYMDNLGNEKTSAQVLVTPVGIAALAANMDKVMARLETI